MQSEFLVCLLAVQEEGDGWRAINLWHREVLLKEDYGDLESDDAFFFPAVFLRELVCV